MSHGRLYRYLRAALSCTTLLVSATVVAQPPSSGAIDPDKASVIEHWTSQRRNAAQPRDLLIGPAGQAYLRKADGSLEPYGRQITAQDSGGPTPLARPSAPAGSNDSTPPSISNLDPGSGDVIGDSYTFSATVTDESGVKSVSFVIRYPDGVTTQKFSPAAGANDTWSVTLRGFSDGNWSWWVEAKDAAGKGGNSGTSDSAYFSVDTGGGSGGTSDAGNGNTITNAEWTDSGTVQTAAGRLYFEMPSNAKRKGPWTGYVCSGTAVTNDATDRSVILTAAHCVYDDENKAYARNVLFIPDQAGTSGSGTDLNCNNDPIGCWVPSFGVVDHNWTIRTFPENIEWDYGYYAVADSGAHVGADSSSDSLESAAGALSINFTTAPYFDVANSEADYTDALGYSYSEDPKLMYCAEDMTTNGAVNWWLPDCGLSGGSSGGPWLQPVDSGDGAIISLNSWGYTSSPGMAGPKLYYDTSTALCVFDWAEVFDGTTVSTADGEAGVDATCP
jgi:hypothetical protein